MVAESMRHGGWAVEGPHGPGTDTHPPATDLDAYRRRREAAEQAAARAEAAAATAAARASEAIAAAARAAEEAEAAAAAANRAAEQAGVAAAAERQARTGGPRTGDPDAADPRGIDMTDVLPITGAGGPLPGAAAPLAGPPVGDSDGDLGPDAGPDGEEATEDDLPSGSESTPALAAAAEPPRAGRRRGPRHGKRGARRAAEPAEPAEPAPQLTDPDDVQDETQVLPAAPDGPDTDVLLTIPADSGRRARDRVAAVAREAARDPETEVFEREEPVDETEAGVEDAPDVESATVRTEAPANARRAERGRRGHAAPQRGARRVLRSLVGTSWADPGRRILAAAAAIVTVVVGTLVVVGRDGAGVPAETAAVVQTPAPAPVVPSPAPAVDPTSAKAVAFLGALHRDGIRTTSSGRSETEAASVICEQLGAGTSTKEIAAAVPAALPAVTEKQAPEVVAAAKKYYC